jgi:hypothetical protein
MRSHWFYTTNEQYLAYLKSKEWLAKRQQIIQRCNNTCERCGKFPVAEVHHLTYASVFHEELADLQGLCEYCHAFLHEERADDGTAEYERLVKRQAELGHRVERAQFEVERFEKHPELYHSFVETRFSSHRELMAILRQNSCIIFEGSECQIFDVRYAKRKYDSAVAFKVKWETPEGDSWMAVKSAEELLYNGKLVLDKERHLWIEIENLRLFVNHYSRAA